MVSHTHTHSPTCISIYKCIYICIHIHISIPLAKATDRLQHGKRCQPPILARSCVPQNRDTKLLACCR